MSRIKRKTGASNLDLATSPKRQLIGEQIGPKRMLQMRLFKSQEEAEIWTRATIGRRFRLARIGSVAWRRALDEELKIAQTAECARASVQKPRAN
jgi:hypothetical protein